MSYVVIVDKPTLTNDKSMIFPFMYNSLQKF